MISRHDVLLYVSGALEGAEALAVEDYLESGNPRAAGERAEAEATLAHLAMSLDPVDPPARVKQALFGRIHASRPRLLARSGRRTVVRRRPGWRSAAFASAATALLAWVGVQAVMNDRISRLEQAVVQHSPELGPLQASAKALALLRSDSPTVKVIELAGPALRRGGYGRVYQNWQTGDCYVSVRGLRPPPHGWAYQLWFRSMEDEALPGGWLRLSPEGGASYLTNLPRNVDVGAPVWLTLEPLRFLRRPSGSPQLEGEIRL